MSQHIDVYSYATFGFTPEERALPSVAFIPPIPSSVEVSIGMDLPQEKEWSG